MADLRAGLPAGAVVGGRYEVIARLAEGGMGSVYRAQHTLSRKVVALKVIHAEAASDEATRQRFLREVAAPAQIGHRGLVEIYDAGFDTPTGALFVAMELLEGETLRHLLERGPIARERAYSIFLRLLEPLAAAHASGFVHRDLKPENVFLQRTVDGIELVKLLDFGIARHLRTEGESVTQTGVAMGTPHYMSPEQAASARDVSYTADVWAVGVMLYEALTGSPPFRGDTLASLVVDVLTRPHRPLIEVVPQVSPEVSRLLDRALDKAEDKRHPNAGALLAELRAALDRPEGASGLHVLPPSVITAPMATSPLLGPLHTPPTTPSIPVMPPAHGQRTPAPTLPLPAGASHAPGGYGSVAPGFGGPSGFAGAMGSVPPTVGIAVSRDTDAAGGWTGGASSPGAAPRHATTGTGAPSPFGASASQPGVTHAPSAPAAPASRTTLYALLGVAAGGIGLIGIVLVIGIGAWLLGPFGAGSVHGALAITDPTLATGPFYDAYEFDWAAGDRITLDVASVAMNPRLIVQTPSGRQYDDDPGLPDAHLELVLDEGGRYRVLVTGSRRGDVGDYDFSVQQR